MKEILNSEAMKLQTAENRKQSLFLKQREPMLQSMCTYVILIFVIQEM